MLKSRLIETLKRTINSLEDELQNEKLKNETYRHDLTILIENGSELRQQITNLELEKEVLNNNIEILFNSLPDNIKELARPTGQY